MGLFDTDDVMIKEELRKENDQLKTENEELKNIIETKLENANICDTALNYINDEYIYAKRQLDQLKQTLTEIKEIAEKPYSLPCGGVCIYPDCEDDLTDNGKYCMELKLKRILQKISECEATNER